MVEPLHAQGFFVGPRSDADFPARGAGRVLAPGTPAPLQTRRTEPPLRPIRRPPCPALARGAVAPLLATARGEKTGGVLRGGQSA